jgi:hypothetical protein
VIGEILAAPFAIAGMLLMGVACAITWLFAREEWEL